MQPKAKILAVSLLLLVGVGAAMLFKKVPPEAPRGHQRGPRQDVSGPPLRGPATAPRLDESGAPPQLLGRIDPLESTRVRRLPLPPDLPAAPLSEATRPGLSATTAKAAELESASPPGPAADSSPSVPAHLPSLATVTPPDLPLAYPSTGLSWPPAATHRAPDLEQDVFGPPVASAAPRETILHKIRDGDTLPSLALRYLGDHLRFREIYELNRDRLAAPDLLPIGLEIRIPRGIAPSEPN